MSRDDDAIKVTRENFGDLLIKGMREALAIERADMEAARRVRRVAMRPEPLAEPPSIRERS